MAHSKHSTIVQVADDGTFLYIATTIGDNPIPHQHKMPLVTLALRAAEYDLDPEDPLALDLVLREHWHPLTPEPDYEVDGVHPLFYLDSVAEAATFMEDRLEEVRVDRRAPAPDTGARMLAGAVAVKAASKGLVTARDRLLQATDPRLVEPVQFYRDQAREKLAAARANHDPVAQFLQRYRADRARTMAP